MWSFDVESRLEARMAAAMRWPRPNAPSSGAEVLSPGTEADGVADVMIEAQRGIQNGKLESEIS